MKIGYLGFLILFGDISDEQMQELWSKILTGEIKKPNTYSLRTLNTLRNITQQEAQLLKKISNFKILHRGVPFITNNTSILKKHNCSYEELLLLQDCGLIDLNGFVRLEFHEEKSIVYNGKVVSIIKGDINIRVFTFSESGKQLLRLIPDDSNFDYTVEVMQQWKTKNKNIQAFKVNRIDENGIDYDEKIDLLQN